MRRVHYVDGSMHGLCLIDEVTRNPVLSSYAFETDEEFYFHCHTTYTKEKGFVFPELAAGEGVVYPDHIDEWMKVCVEKYDLYHVPGVHEPKSSTVYYVHQQNESRLFTLQINALGAISGLHDPDGKFHCGSETQMFVIMCEQIRLERLRSLL